ncbi:MAG: hypothetical protein J7L47_10910 [Candidatus Odinarchaeota archaeon]|nr:hypothetical protein [Candidatus Odinarchaeota archaeon]
MRHVSFDYKPKDGKLLRIVLDYEEDKIRQVKLFGDYFLYPEEAIFEIEKALVGIKLKREEILNTLNAKFKELGVVSIGITPENICEGILLAYNKEKSL